jgi:predicted RNA-binding Zn-ribbon protein involved in translation (DUF1610 family)
MEHPMYQFTCPRCGGILVALVPDAAVAANGDLHIPCIRGRRPPGCGETVILKPSSGFQLS